LASLWRRKDGATAVEFALVAVPFFWIMFGIIEIAGISLIQTSLDAAVSETTREIRTGQTQGARQNAAQFKQRVCTYLNRLMPADCTGSLYIDARRFTDFSTVAGTNPVNGGAIDPTRMRFETGGASEIVLVRVYYKWKIFTPLFGRFFANLGAEDRLIVSSSLFRNEPF
jgi:Flp pilus assembly protein TadG